MPAGKKIIEQAGCRRIFRRRWLDKTPDQWRMLNMVCGKETLPHLHQQFVEEIA